jgi:hypothetical protein
MESLMLRQRIRNKLAYGFGNLWELDLDRRTFLSLPGESAEHKEHDHDDQKAAHNQCKYGVAAAAIAIRHAELLYRPYE